MQRMRMTVGMLALLVLALPFFYPQAAAARTWPTVRKGDSGENVVTLQASLSYRGYSVGVDGAFGPGTETVVKSFQQANGLSADGIVGAQSWETLFVVVRQGDNNTVVNALQRQLKNKYGYSLSLDGAFGAGTHNAVVSFQQSKGLGADGIVGGDTWAALLSGTASGGTSTYLTHAEAQAMLSAAGIPVVSSGNCSDRNNRTCTSLDQIRRNTITGVIGFKQASGCSFNITGGTEIGHSGGTYSHSNGYKVDISRLSCVTNYISTRYTSIGNRGDGAPQYRDANGSIYADEYFANHWDILYY